MIANSLTANRGLVPQLLSSVLFAFATVALLIGMFFANKALVGALLGGIPLLALFLASTNQRLFCLWGLVLTAPLSLGKSYLVIPHMGGADAYSIDFSDIFLLMLLLFILRDHVTGERRALRFSPYAFWWGGLILLGVFDTIYRPWRQLPGEEVLRMVKCFLIFFVIINEMVHVRSFLNVAAALLAGVAFEAVLGLTQFVTNANLGLQALGEPAARILEYTTEIGFGGSAFNRVAGVLWHPNMLGAYLAMLLPIGIALLLSQIKQRYKLMIGGVVGMGALTLLLTLSRSSWLSFCVAFVAILVLSFVHPRLRHRFLFARFAAIASLLLMVVAFSGVIERRLSGSDPSAINFRWEWLGVAWQMVKEQPLLGYGLNTFVYHLPGHTKFGGVQGLNYQFGDEWPVVHNIYMLVWAEQGTIGFILFLGFNLYLIRLGLRNLRRIQDDTLFILNLGCLAGFLAIVTDGFSSFFLRVAPGGRVFAIVTGLLVAIDYWTRASSASAAQALPTPASSDGLPAPAIAD